MGPLPDNPGRVPLAADAARTHTDLPHSTITAPHHRTPCSAASPACLSSSACLQSRRDTPALSGRQVRRPRRSFPCEHPDQRRLDSNTLSQPGWLAGVLCSIVSAVNFVMTCPLNYDSVLGRAHFSIIHAAEMGRSKHHV